MIKMLLKNAAERFSSINPLVPEFYAISDKIYCPTLKYSSDE